MRAPSRRCSIAAAAALVAVTAAAVAIAFGVRPSLGTTTTRPDAVGRALLGYRAGLDTLDRRIAALAAAAGTSDTLASRRALAEARIAYKRVELLAEHFTPLTALAMNGPAQARPDEENPRVDVAPSGLQVVEAALYERAPNATERVATQARTLAVLAHRLRDVAGYTTVTDAQLFDAARQEIARVVALGLAGYDTPLARTALPEAASALAGVGATVAAYAPNTRARAAFDSTLGAAIAVLRAGGDPDTFDYYDFVTRRANPLARALIALRDAAGVAPFAERRAWSASAATLFDAGAFDASAFAPPDAPTTSGPLVALGAVLFDERALSGRGDRSCATCHVPTRAFADGRVRAAMLTGAHVATRNTPTLLNAALQRAAFADARVAYLEDQVTAVIESPAEMGGSLDSAVGRLRGDARYRALFAAAFRGDEAQVTSRGVRFALAAYVRTLARLDAPFDRAMRDGGVPLDAPARRGFGVFMGKGRCGSCHFAPLFGGTVPPGFDETEAEVIGVPSRAMPHAATVDGDRGSGAVDRSPLHDRAFKTPSLRNVAATAPYMHNGVYRTLEEVVDFYDRGGGVGIGARVPNQTLSVHPLHLTRTEQADLIAFLRSLTDAVIDRGVDDGAR